MCPQSYDTLTTYLNGSPKKYTVLNEMNTDLKNTSKSVILVYFSSAGFATNHPADVQVKFIPSFNNEIDEILK